MLYSLHRWQKPTTLVIMDKAVYYIQSSIYSGILLFFLNQEDNVMYIQTNLKKNNNS